MEFTINVHVTGLDKLADAIASLSATKTGTPTHTNTMIASAQNVNIPVENAAPSTPENPTHTNVTVAPAQTSTVPPISAGPVPDPRPTVNPTLAGSPTSAPVPAVTDPCQTGVPTSITDITQTAPVAPAAVPTYTVDELARAAAPLMGSPSDMQTLCNLLAQFGVQSLQQLPEDTYGAFATELRRLGASI